MGCLRSHITISSGLAYMKGGLLAGACDYNAYMKKGLVAGACAYNKPTQTCAHCCFQMVVKQSYMGRGVDLLAQ